mgnify:CR=1 FL=1
MHPLGTGLGNIDFVIYTYWRYAANNLGMIESLIYVLVLDIYSISLLVTLMQ